MDSEKIYFEASCGNGCRTAAMFFRHDSQVVARGTVQICHGMAEYLGCYEEFIRVLTADGWDVCGMDMMGHGDTYEINRALGMPKGYFGEGREAAFSILADEMKVRKLAEERLGFGGPWILLGHSMGSFVVRNIYTMPQYASRFDKFVFSSTMGPNPAVGLALLIANVMIAFGRDRVEGHLIDKLTFGSYNKHIRAPRTDFDWLNSDEAAIDRYIADPMCGFSFCNGGFRALFMLVKRMQQPRTYASSSLRPCLMIYGSEDPVGGYGKGAAKVARRFADAGCPVTEICYEGCRHEPRNEPEFRERYFRDILQFIDDRSDLPT